MHSSSCRQAEGQEGPCKRYDDVNLRRLRQTMRLAHWSVCPSQVAPMTRGSVDLDDSVHRVCVCVCVRVSHSVRVRLAHWSVCPSQVAPMTWESVDLDDSVHRVCVCVFRCADRNVGLSAGARDQSTSSAGGNRRDANSQSDTDRHHDKGRRRNQSRYDAIRYEMLF